MAVVACNSMATQDCRFTTGDTFIAGSVVADANYQSGYAWKSTNSGFGYVHGCGGVSTKISAASPNTKINYLFGQWGWDVWGTPSAGFKVTILCLNNDVLDGTVGYFSSPSTLPGLYLEGDNNHVFALGIVDSAGVLKGLSGTTWSPVQHQKYDIEISLTYSDATHLQGVLRVDGAIIDTYTVAVANTGDMTLSHGGLGLNVCAGVAGVGLQSRSDCAILVDGDTSVQSDPKGASWPRNGGLTIDLLLPNGNTTTTSDSVASNAYLDETGAGATYPHWNPALGSVTVQNPATYNISTNPDTRQASTFPAYSVTNKTILAVQNVCHVSQMDRVRNHPILDDGGGTVLAAAETGRAISTRMIQTRTSIQKTSAAANWDATAMGRLVAGMERKTFFGAGNAIQNSSMALFVVYYTTATPSLPPIRGRAIRHLIGR